MTLRDIFSKLWPDKNSAEKQLRILTRQIDSASEDLKIRIAESLANTASLERKMEQQDSSAEVDGNDRAAMLQNALASERSLLEGLQVLFKDLKKKREEINLALEQNQVRQRKAATDELLTAVYRDFGSDLKLNHYLEKFSSETLRIEYTAESNLRVELLNRRSGQ